MTKKGGNEFRKSVVGIISIGLAIILLLFISTTYYHNNNENDFYPDRYLRSHVALVPLLPDMADNIRVIDKGWILFDIQDNHFICYVSCSGNLHIMSIQNNITLKSIQNEQ